MSYADLYPVRSYYSSPHPVCLVIDGREEEEVEAREVQSTPLPEPVLSPSPHRQRHHHPHSYQSTSKPSQHTRGNLPSSLLATVSLVLDSNALLSHLPLLANLHRLLSLSNSPPLSIIVPSPVLRELDGLKSSEKPVDGFVQRKGELSRHASSITIGSLARKATRFLFEEGRSQRKGGRVGGVLRLVEAPEGQPDLSVDDQILSICIFAQSSRHSPSHPYTPPPSSRVILFTSDINLAARAEYASVETLTSNIPKDPCTLLSRLGLDLSSPNNEGQPPSMEVSYETAESVGGDTWMMDIDD